MRNGSNEHKGRRERRRYKRAHVLFSGRLVSGKRAIEGLVVDLSASGVGLHLAEPLEADSAVTLRLAGSVDFHVEVAWLQKDRLGLRFRETPARVSSIFAGLLPEGCLATA